MNSTTWIIEPNVWAWGLLGLATISILTIAVCFTILTYRGKQSNKQPTNLASKEVDNNDSGANYKVLVIINIVLILFLIGIACVLCFGGVSLKSEGSASVLISALGVLVTFLVTWQIGLSLISREEVRKIERVSNRLNTIEKQMIMLRNTPDGHLFYVLAINKFEKQEYYTAFEYFAIATSTFIENNIPYEKFPTVALSYMNDCIEKAKETEKDLDVFRNRAQGVYERLDSLAEQVNNIERFADEARGKVNLIREKMRQYGITPQASQTPPNSSETNGDTK